MSETRHPENPFAGVPANADPEPGGWGWQVVPHSEGSTETQPGAQRVTSGWEVVTSENEEVGKRRTLVTGAQLKRAAKLVFFSIIWVALIAMLLGVLLAIITKFV